MESSGGGGSSGRTGSSPSRRAAGLRGAVQRVARDRRTAVGAFPSLVFLVLRGLPGGGEPGWGPSGGPGLSADSAGCGPRSAVKRELCSRVRLRGRGWGEQGGPQSRRSLWPGSPCSTLSPLPAVGAPLPTLRPSRTPRFLSAHPVSCRTPAPACWASERLRRGCDGGHALLAGSGLGARSPVTSGQEAPEPEEAGPRPPGPHGTGGRGAGLAVTRCEGFTRGRGAGSGPCYFAGGGG